MTDQDIPVRDGEHVAQLPTGEYIAVRVARTINGAAVNYHATARAIAPDGSPIRDAVGRPVERALQYQSRNVAAVESITADCERAVLGEPTEMEPPWSESFLQDASIRVALDLAPFAG